MGNLLPVFEFVLVAGFSNAPLWAIKKGFDQTVSANIVSLMSA